MDTKTFPLEELSIYQLYCMDNALTYEIPIYQRNYAWEDVQIRTLIQDVWDAYEASKLKPTTYYIGTLVTFDKGERVYEVIDGQQRLTTIYIILKALKCNDKIKSQLTYHARKKSKATLLHLGQYIDGMDVEQGIANGFDVAVASVNEISLNDLVGFTDFFLHYVHIIHYRVPNDVDLNHYFEVMNSRGEQLEMHEIVKVQLCNQLLSKDDRSRFNRIWEACSNMNIYIQQLLKDERVFGSDLSQYPCIDFDNLPIGENTQSGTPTINELMSVCDLYKAEIDEEEDVDKFEPIIDFPNFLLIVLKITRMEEADFDYTEFTLDDKALIKEFNKVPKDERFVKRFAMNLLRAKYLLDNFIVHHTNDSEQDGTNPWQLEVYIREDGLCHTRNLATNNPTLQNELVQLLSMFEVTFSPHQRKNYLFYCLLFLFHNIDTQSYLNFLRRLADKYFYDVYLNPQSLNTTNNHPIPNRFDQVMLRHHSVYTDIENLTPDFIAIYGDGSEVCKGIQLYLFNYTDYKLWQKYANEMRGCNYKEEQLDRKRFFDELGCSDFGFDFFRKFYFSRTRKSLEHFYPQAKAGEGKALSDSQINCFGNFAMIGSNANSRGSNWYPVAKIDFYKDSKLDQVSVASLKLKIMMQMCQDNRDAHRKPDDEWNFHDIQIHQSKMLSIIMR